MLFEGLALSLRQRGVHHPLHHAGVEFRKLLEFLQTTMNANHRARSNSEMKVRGARIHHGVQHFGQHDVVLFALGFRRCPLISSIVNRGLTDRNVANIGRLRHGSTQGSRSVILLRRC